MRIDINCDMGESFGAYRMGEDEAVIRHITSANIACGFHAGDPSVMARTVMLAREHGVAVGAHPGYPDLVGFGRRNMDMEPDRIKHDLLYQLGALSAFTRAAGVPLCHVKPHGALYNLASGDERAAGEIIEAVLELDPELILFALAGSLLVEIASARGLRVAREIFPDRAYLSTGQLAPRGMAGAVIHDVDAVLSRTIRLLSTGRMECIDGREVPLQGETLCVHGDAPGASRIAGSLRQALEKNGHRVMAVHA